MTFDTEKNFYIPRKYMREMSNQMLLTFSILNQEQQSSPDHTCAVSLAYLSQYSCCSKNTVKKVLKDLEDEGYISVLKKGTGSETTVYQVLKPVEFN